MPRQAGIDQPISDLTAQQIRSFTQQMMKAELRSNNAFNRLNFVKAYPHHNNGEFKDFLTKIQPQKENRQALAEISQLSNSTSNNTADIGALSARLEKLGITIDQKITHLLHNSEAARKHFDVVENYITEQKAMEKNAREMKDYQGVGDAFGFVAAVGSHFKNETVMQIGVAGQAFTQIATATKLLSSAETMMSLASLSNFANIGMAVLTVISLFGKKENPNQGMIEMLQMLSAQLHEFRQEMHQRFDQIKDFLGDIYVKLIQGVSEIRVDSFEIKEFLRDLKEELQSGHQDIKDSLHTLSTQLRVISKNQKDADRRNKIEDLFKKINEITNPRKLSTDRFIQLYNDLESEIKGLSANNASLVGSDHDALKSFEDDADNFFNADFNIRILFNEAKRLGGLVENLIDLPESTPNNPIVLCWQLLAIRALTEDRYKLSLKEGVKVSIGDVISDAEVDQLKQLETVLQQTNALIASFNNPKLINLLFAQMREAGKQFADKLKEYTTEQEQKISDELNAQAKESTDICNVNLINAFAEQKPPTNVNIKKNWGDHYSENHYSEGCYTKHPASYKMMCERRGLGFYVNQRNKEIAAQKEEIIQEIRRPLVIAGNNGNRLYSNQFYFFKDPEINGPRYNNFVFPENPDHLLLTSLLNFCFKTPKEFYQSEFMRRGDIRTRYQMDKKAITLKHKFERGNKQENICTLEIPTDEKNPYEDDRERAWLLYFGGNYSQDGAAENTFMIQEGQWKNYTVMPICKPVDGFRKTIQREEKTGNVLNAEEKIHYDHNTIKLLQDEIRQERYKRSIEFAQMLKSKLERESSSPLAQALKTYSCQFYLLQSILKLAFPDRLATDEMLSDYFSTKQMYLNVSEGGETKREENKNDATPIIRNRLDFLNFLDNYQGGDTSFDEYIRTNIAYQASVVASNTSKLLNNNNEAHYYSLVSGTLNAFSQLINEYKAIAVKENSLVTASSREQKAEEKAQFFGTALAMLNEAISSSLDPDTQQKLMRSFQQAWESQGLAGSPANLLSFSPGASSSSGSSRASSEPKAKFSIADKLGSKGFFARNRTTEILSKTGMRTTLEGKPVYFARIKNNGTNATHRQQGSCGYISLNVPRDEVKRVLEQALEAKEETSLEIRKLIGGQIANDFREGCLRLSDDNTKKLSELMEAFSVSQELSSSSSASAGQAQQAEQNLMVFLCDKELAKDYFKHNILDTWMPMRAAKAYAMATDTPFTVFGINTQPKAGDKDPDDLYPIEMESFKATSTSTRTPKNIIFMGNHYEELVEVPAPSAQLTRTN